MEPVKVFLLSILLFSGTSGAAECEKDWIAFKDELCIKIFSTDFIDFEEAQAFCSSQGTQLSKATLVMVKDSEMQDLLATYTSHIYDNVWLGGRYDHETAQFRWIDGQPLTYNNWEQGRPRNNTGTDTCVELRPVNARSSTTSVGKWADAACQRRNLAICQKPLSWTLQDAVDEIIRIRNNLRTAQDELNTTQADLETTKTDLETTKTELQTTKTELQTTKNDLQTTKTELQTTKTELQTTKNDLQTTKNNLQTTKNDLQTTKNDLQTTKTDLQTTKTRVVPIGSIYIEYYNQPSPRSLWPSFTWQDISSTYAGLFFRTSGGGSAGWGTTQSECAPRITQMDGAWFSSKPASPLSIPANGWSGYGYAGYQLKTGPYDYDGIKFHTAGCEVRPKNQAVRVWKRTG